MLNIKVLKNENDFSEHLDRTRFIDFLHHHLERFGDSKEAIGKSVDYALAKDGGKGGFLLAAYEGDTLIGELVMNQTGMSGYIPEYILVYVAVDSACRGKGYGGQIIKKSFELCKGDVKLHVEYDNPAKRLYERLGFTNKYAEMRYTNK